MIHTHVHTMGIKAFKCEKIGWVCFFFVHFMCGTHKNAHHKLSAFGTRKLFCIFNAVDQIAPKCLGTQKYTIQFQTSKENGKIVLFYFWQPITENGEMTITNKNESVHMIRAFQFNRIAIDSVIAVNLILQLMQI